MKKWLFLPLLALLLSGCSFLLERSYSVEKPYTDRYWDSGAEDTLRVENYQDLVNSLLMLVEQRAEEAVIRCYFGEDVNVYTTARDACGEVRRETILGSYLLKSLTFSTTGGAGYTTLACHMVYREDAEDPESIMTLSDSQSLVDLLRLTVREDRDKVTARFVSDIPRQEVTAAVDAFWQELCRDAALESLEPTFLPEDEAPPGKAQEPPEETEELETPPDTPPEKTSEEPDAAGAIPASGLTEDGESADGEPPEPEYPPCPWTILFYPDQEETNIVEILLTEVR